MPEFTAADRIWNRACLNQVAGLPMGDQALAAMILAHGLVMNGGVIHAIECLTADQLAAAKAGYRYFDLADVDALLDVAASAIDDDEDPDSWEKALDVRYGALIPDDPFLVARFEAALHRNPAAFAPP